MDSAFRTPVGRVEDENALSPEQMSILIILERVGAGLSMAAIALTILSYIAFRKLRTTPNLFLLCASIANAGASCASMMGYAGMHAGLESALCQMQAFIFQVFMQADPWWSFAMAVNVFLVFFHNADPSAFRKHLWAYCIICFGGPLLSGLVLINIRGDPRGPIFGDAVCWIDTRWSLVRIYSYYIPVWICILLSLVIYIAVGYHVFHARNQFRNIGGQESNDSGKQGHISSSNGTESSNGVPTQYLDFYGTAVTEVEVTTDTPSMSNLACHDFLTVTLPPTARRSQQRSRNRSHSWVKSSDERFASGAGSHQFQTVCSSDNRPPPHSKFTGRLHAAKTSASLKLRRLDPVKVAYLRTSFIFGLAIFVTWIPSSVNRLYSITNEDKVSFHLSVASGCVLPLQGVWNALIYFSTSWSTVRQELRHVASKLFHFGEEDRRTTLRPEGSMYDSSHRCTLERVRSSHEPSRNSNVAGSNEIELCAHDLAARSV